MSKFSEFLLDIFTFILHLAVFLMLIAGAGFLVAPLFGADPTQTEIVQAVLFATFAITILVFDIKLIAKAASAHTLSSTA